MKNQMLLVLVIILLGLVGAMVYIYNTRIVAQKTSPILSNGNSKDIAETPAGTSKDQNAGENGDNSAESDKKDHISGLNAFGSIDIPADTMNSEEKLEQYLTDYNCGVSCCGNHTGLAAKKSNIRPTRFLYSELR